MFAASLLTVSPTQAGWWSSPAAEDTDDALLSGARQARIEAAADQSWVSPSRLAGAGDWLGRTAVNAALTIPPMVTVPLSAIGHQVSSTATAVGQFTWEVAYVFGVNGTPVAPVQVRDHGQTALHEPIAANSDPDSAAPPPAPPPSSDPQTETAPPPPPADTAPPEKTATPKEDSVTPEGSPADARLLAGLTFDKSRRQPDGSYFVPKPLQRLFDIRTQKADTTQSPLTVKLPGRIVPDPNAHGDVEASLIGRIEPPKTGQPVLGETVRQGQILGYVTPAVGVVDRTQVRREVARLTNEIRITAESLEILKQFWFVPFRDGKVMQAELRLDSLRRERAALVPLLQTQEVLRAAIDGVISVSNAINGRIVHPGDKIFEIVNPRRLWIEAIAADPEVARGAASVRNAIALTPEGESLDVAFVGSGLALQQQSVPLMFRIDNPIDGLRVGRPVTVNIRNPERLRHGIPVPREALVTDSSGAEQVWELVAPEIFMPHTVKTEILDGRSVLIVAGVETGARIVTRGARLLSQLQ